MIALPLVENEEYFYDAAAAERPILFAAKYLKHYEGADFAGKPFTFLSWQNDLTRTMFGWKRRRDGLRRFSELYLLTAKGAGKTPWLAAIGLFALLGDGEPGASVISSATDFAQAKLTLDGGKNYVKAEPALAARCKVKQFNILAPKHSKWEVISGTADGRHGFRPTCLLMDEAHEWPSGKLYNNLTANMFKRRQPLILVATNAGESQASFCWRLDQRARRVLDGDTSDPGLLPVIYEAPRELDWQSEAAAAAANPSMGQIVKFSALASELVKAQQDDAAKARYCRLYLSWWPETAAEAWLDLAEWDRCAKPIDAAAIKAAVCYIGMDLSLNNDLCAVAAIWVIAGRMYVKVWFWLPRKMAEAYEASHGIPYTLWEAEGHIILVDEPTISDAVRSRIAAHILAIGKHHKIRAVCYDAARAENTIAELEGAGVTAVPVRQGYTLSPGLEELDRRIKEQSIDIDPNPCLRWNAECAEVRRDEKANIYLVKPGAKERYAGTRFKKVDGLAAIADALTEARKHAFAEAKKKFQGQICKL